MASLLSTIVNQTTEQPGLKQDQFVLLLTHIEGLQTKVGVAQLVGEADKAGRRIHENDLPRDNEIDLVTIHHSTIDRAYGGIAYLYEFTDQKDPSRTLGEMVRAGMFVWDSYIKVPVYGNADAWSPESHVYMDAVCPGMKVGAVSVPSDVQPAESGNHVSKRCS